MVGGARYNRNVVRGSLTPDWTAMSMFCGFPIGVMVEPMVTEKARTRTTSSGSRLSALATGTAMMDPIAATASFTAIAARSPKVMVSRYRAALLVRAL